MTTTGIPEAVLKIIRRKLLRWYCSNKRDVPWRNTQDPYRIWISEIMLQQTRMAAVIPYYERFLSRFPDLIALASAHESEVLQLWSGLGYYSRARNMHRAAAKIAEAGAFPRDYASLRTLPGIGDYTAAAIASIAFQQPYPVMDGNVLRVLSRLTNERGDIATTAVRTRLRRIAAALLDTRNPGSFNQALMDFGAVLCIPGKPHCEACPVAACCRAQIAGTQNELPVKAALRRRVRVEASLLVVRRNGSVLLRQRHEGRLKGLWELPDDDTIPKAIPGKTFGIFRHSITCTDYVFTVVSARVGRVPSGFAWVNPRTMAGIPLTGATKKALKLAAFL